MPRYGRQEDLLRLALMMQASAEGVSLADIEREFTVSRRTAERMRDTLRNVYPQLEEINGESGQKRWRFPPGTLARMEEPTVVELAAAHRALALVKREGDLATAEVLEQLLTKVRAQLTGPRRARVAPDLEAQLLADGVAFRPGPREHIAPAILQALREAILAGRMISVDYCRRSSKKASHNIRLGPIAVLFGEGRQYLVAWTEYKDDLRLFALVGLQKVRLEPDVYVRPPDFDLKEWLAQSFGIWREEPFDVEWLFKPEVADEAATYQFHPKQEIERLDDGSLIVRFRAGGRNEMDWYLYRWGDKVEVRKPCRLGLQQGSN